MKYLLLIGAALLAGCSNSDAADPDPVDDEPVFIQMSSLTDQVLSEEEIEPGLILPEIIDGQQGIEIDENHSILIPETGVYTIMLAPQSGKLAGCGRYWIAVNGVAVENSSVQICQACPTLTGVAVSQATMMLQEADEVSFWQSGDLGIQATVPEGIDEPAVPSVIITVFKL